MEFPITTHFNGIEDDLLGGTESGGPHGTMYSNGREVDWVSDASVRFTVCTYFPFECFPNKTLFLAPVSSRYGREKKVSRRGWKKGMCDFAVLFLFLPFLNHSVSLLSLPLKETIWRLVSFARWTLMKPHLPSYSFIDISAVFMCSSISQHYRYRNIFVVGVFLLIYRKGAETCFGIITEGAYPVLSFCVWGTYSCSEIWSF